MKRTAFIAFVMVTLVYITLGSLVFHFIEGENEKEQKKTFELEHADFLESHTCLSREALIKYIGKVKAAYSEGVPVLSIITKGLNSTNSSLDIVDHHDTKWDLASTILFSVTVISTIGYGNLAPKTSGGQAFCIIFSLLGIPLFATCLVGIGERLQIPLQRIKKCKAWYKKDPKKDERLKTGVFLTSGVCLLVFIPSYVLSVTEDWTYIEALYFCVITLTTVGFGDYIPGTLDRDVPGRSTDIWSFYLHRIILGVWILLGLSWVALIFSEVASIMKEQIVEAARKTSNKFVDLEGMVKKKAKDARERIVQKASTHWHRRTHPISGDVYKFRKDRDHDVSGVAEEVDVIVEEDVYVIKSPSKTSPKRCNDEEANGIPGVYRSLTSIDSFDSNIDNANTDNKEENNTKNKDTNTKNHIDAIPLDEKDSSNDDNLSRVDM